jgi:hypothetical protein
VNASAGRKFSRCHRHLFHMVRDPKRFVFNAEAVNRPSDRQIKYGDKRADPNGKVWDDVWGVGQKTTGMTTVRRARRSRAWSTTPPSGSRSSRRSSPGAAAADRRRRVRPRRRGPRPVQRQRHDRRRLRRAGAAVHRHREEQELRRHCPRFGSARWPRKGRRHDIITATDVQTRIDGVPVRLWEGVTEEGTPCKVFVHRVAVHNDHDSSRFEKELEEEAAAGASPAPVAGAVAKRKKKGPRRDERLGARRQRTMASLAAPTEGRQRNPMEPAQEIPPLGRRHAYTGVIRKGRKRGEAPYGIGRADEGTAGYTPCPELGTFHDLVAAQREAEQLNAALGLDKLEAWKIVADTIGRQRDR